MCNCCMFQPRLLGDRMMKNHPINPITYSKRTMAFNCLFNILLVIAIAHTLLISDETNAIRQAAHTDDSGDVNQSATTTQMSQRLNEIFNFQSYKKLFNKTYGRLEEIVRRKYLLARAFRAWISSIKYKFHQSSYCFALNHLSDRSPDELNLMLLNTVHSKDKSAESKDFLNEDGTTYNNDDARDDHEPRQLNQMTNVEESQDLRAAHEHWLSQTWTKTGEVQVVETAHGGHSKPMGNSSSQRSPQLTPSPVTRNIPIEYLNWVEAPLIEQKVDKNLRRVAAKNNQSQQLADEVFFDHRGSSDSCMFLPRDQGLCSSCYAFAAITVAEWLYCKRTGRLEAFSEQYLVDCGGPVGGYGCYGGRMEQTSTFIHNFGLEFRSKYPYKHRADQCPYDENTSPQSMGAVRMHLADLTLVPLERLADFIPFAPMVIGMHAEASFIEYGRGVLDGSDCVPNSNHAVVLVGHGRENGREYWLIRNSFSVGWGEDGYCKLAKDSDCIHPRRGLIFGALPGKWTYTLKEDDGYNAWIIRNHYKRYKQNTGIFEEKTKLAVSKY